MNKKIVIAAPLILIGVFSVIFFKDSEPENLDQPEEEAEVNIEESLDEIGDIFELEDDLLDLEEAGLVGEEVLEEYYELENRYFILIDSYYGGEVSREELTNEIDDLLADINNLEEKITNLNKQ